MEDTVERDQLTLATAMVVMEVSEVPMEVSEVVMEVTQVVLEVTEVVMEATGDMDGESKLFILIPSNSYPR